MGIVIREGIFEKLKVMKYIIFRGYLKTDLKFCFHELLIGKEKVGHCMN